MYPLFIILFINCQLLQENVVATNNGCHNMFVRSQAYGTEFTAEVLLLVYSVFVCFNVFTNLIMN